MCEEKVSETVISGDGWFLNRVVSLSAGFQLSALKIDRAMTLPQAALWTYALQ